MEHQQELSMESFSFTWSRDSIPPDNPDSFIEMDPRVMSLRWAAAESHELNFSDQSESDGLLLLPVQQFMTTTTAAAATATPEMKNPLSPDSVLSKSLSAGTESSKMVRRCRFPQVCDVQKRPTSMSPFPLILHHSMDSSKGKNRARKRWSSKRIILKYFCFLKPLLMKGKGQASQRRFDEPLSLDNGRLDVGMERALHEAVLHCKRSIGK